jgi:RDD family protein
VARERVFAYPEGIASAELMGLPDMNSDTALPPPLPRAPLYARFVRRLCAMVVDVIVILLLIYGAVFAATIAHTDNIARALGLTVVVIFLLYEPVLVCMTGSTIGHYYANLRVVDDRHHGNVSFLKAVARLVIKSVLGWYSFITMTATRRNQALHDQLTRSTVQMRDPAKALPGHYITERTEFSNPNMPSRIRRTIVTLGYLLLISAMFMIGMAILSATGVLGPCEFIGCSPGQRIADIAVALIWLIASAWIIGLGWRGKLFGARLRAKS